MRHLRFGEAAEREAALQSRIDQLIRQRHRIANAERERQRLVFERCHADIHRQITGNAVAHRQTERLAVRFHAETFRDEREALSGLARERQLRERHGEPSDRVFAKLRRRAVHRDALRLHADAAVDRRHRHLFRRDLRGCLRRTFHLRHSIRRGDVARLAALKARQNIIACLMQRARVRAVQDALFAVDERVFAVRCEAHDRHFSAMRGVPRHIAAAGLLVRAEDHADAPGRLKAALLQRCERVDRRDHRPLVVHRAAAVDAAVFDLARKRLALRPAVAGRNHIKMTQHRDHLFSLAVLAPADTVIHVFRRKAEFFTQSKHFVQAARRFLAERSALLRLTLHARNAHERCKRRKQLVAVRMNISFEIHSGFLPFIAEKFSFRCRDNRHSKQSIVSCIHKVKQKTHI